MNYTEAVKLARAGKQQGFDFLFESTYKSKYYLALQYMRDEEAAKDVLQEAYMRAFSKLEALQNPEAFPGWLGIIVANTARNMLAKKSPQLFSAVDSEEGTDRPEFQIADERIDSQPELAYTRQETQELVHELIDSLSAEQRMCILMFYIEGASIKEIAAAAGCSENTVKSRLNYGRKNLKSKAEVLQRKGYRLYGAAPLPLLLLLLRAECRAMDADGAFAAVGRAVRETIFSAAHVGNLSHMSALAGKTAKKSCRQKGLKGGLYTYSGREGCRHSSRRMRHRCGRVWRGFLDFLPLRQHGGIRGRLCPLRPDRSEVYRRLRDKHESDRHADQSDRCGLG